MIRPEDLLEIPQNYMSALYQELINIFGINTGVSKYDRISKLLYFMKEQAKNIGVGVLFILKYIQLSYI